MNLAVTVYVDTPDDATVSSGHLIWNSVMRASKVFWILLLLIPFFVTGFCVIGGIVLWLAMAATDR